MMEETVTHIARLTAKVTVPSRSLTAVTVRMTLPPCKNKMQWDFTITQEGSLSEPNCVIYPLDYATIKGGLQKGLQVIINLSRHEIKLQEGMVLGYFQQTQDEEIMVTKEDIFGINVTEPWTPEEIEEEVLKGDGQGFTTSPVDIDPREPIKLRDAEVAPQHREAFKNLCIECQDVFSKDSADLGKTPLLKMDIPTGDSPRITQRPYTLALKHVQWVQEEIAILEKAGIIAKSVSPWASLIVIVPKKTAPGEPPRRRMCVDYHMLNQLLPKVDKVHSKAKGVLTLVPLPKIDEIYAKLEGSTIYSTFDMRSGYYHLELSQESQPKSAFVVGGPKGGKWEFKRCPFGLTQAQAYFQMLVYKVLEGLEFAFGYLDNILIYSKSMDEHLQHVRTLFERMRWAYLKLPRDLSTVVLKLAHDDLGYNGSARMYMILRRNYYWKGLRPDVVKYVKMCTVCRKLNSASPKCNKRTFQAQGAPMDFISMDLIGEFHPPSSQGKKYTLTVICMLSGWTWCIPIPDKTTPIVVGAYLKHVHHVFGPSRKILSDNGTEFNNKLF